MPVIQTLSARTGMVISEPILDRETGKVLINQGVKLTDNLIQGLRKKGISDLSVYDQYTLALDPNDAISSVMKTELCRRVRKYAPDYPEGNKSDKMVQISAMCCQLAEKLAGNQVCIDYCTEMKIVNPELLDHSFEVCALSLLTAGAVGMGPGEIFNAGFAGLLHDVGLLEMPFLIGKTGLSPSDQLLYNEHTTYGHYLARERGAPMDVAEIIYSHHEDYNGGGYPRSLAGENIIAGAHVVRVCDSFDSRTRFDSMPAHHAVEMLYGAGGIYYNPNVVAAFLSNISVYPLGSLVKLSTGETGVVVNVRRNLGERPVVSVWYNVSDRRYETPKLIDLGVELTVFIQSVL